MLIVTTAPDIVAIVTTAPDLVVAGVEVKEKRSKSSFSVSPGAGFWVQAAFRALTSED